MLNEHFVCIKVDREERPDIDHIYMTALQRAGQQRRLAAVDVPDCPTAGRSSAAPTGRARTGRSRARRSAASRPILKTVHESTTKNAKTSRSRPTKVADGHGTALDSAGSRGIAIVDARPRAAGRGRRGAEGASSTGLRRLRQSGAQVPRHEVPDAAAPRVPARPRRSAHEGQTSSTTMVTPTLDQMATAASTTSSAAASTATAPSAPGPCRTSRRCSTTTPNSSKSTPGLPR